MPNGLKLLSVVCGFALFILIAGCVVAAGQQGIAESLGRIWSLWWGRVMLLDLYAGLLLAAGWVWRVERRPPVAAAWTVGLLCLGNIVTLVFVMLRARRSGSWSDFWTPDAHARTTPTA